jgi:hypothetical protein
MRSRLRRVVVPCSPISGNAVADWPQAFWRNIAILQIIQGISKRERSTVPWIDQSRRREKAFLRIVQVTDGHAWFALTDSIEVLRIESNGRPPDDG